MDLVTRDQWGARPPRSTSRLPDTDLHGLGVHYTASEADRAPTHETCDDRVRAIQRFHMDGRRWQDIAYSFLVCYHGSVFEGRGWRTRTAANGTNWANDHYLACCFLGHDKDGRDDVTDDGRRAIVSVVREMQSRVPAAIKVLSHSDFKATACPGNELRAWVRAGMPIPAPQRTQGGVVINRPPVVILTHPSWPERAYVVVSDDGGTFAFGGAPNHGSLGGIALNAPIVDAKVTSSGGGWVMLGRDGGVFPFGDAPPYWEEGRVEYQGG